MHVPNNIYEIGRNTRINEPTFNGCSKISYRKRNWMKYTFVTSFSRENVENLTDEKHCDNREQSGSSCSGERKMSQNASEPEFNTRSRQYRRLPKYSVGTPLRGVDQGSHLCTIWSEWLVGAVPGNRSHVRGG